VEQTAQQAYSTVMQTVGATLPVPDREDMRILDNLKLRGGTFLNANQLSWPILASGSLPLDTDQDGMPDSWEQSMFGSGSQTLASASNDYDGDGYTDLEEYLNQKDGSPGADPAPDTLLPTVGITAPVAGATLSGSSTTFSAAASDNTGVVGVQFMLNGVKLGQEDTSAPYSITWKPTSAANGTYKLAAVARDIAGNRVQSLEVTFNVSNPAPAPTPGNLLLNPAFEFDRDGNARPDGWSTNSGFTRSSDADRSGSFGGKLKGTDNSGYTTYQLLTRLSARNYSFSGAVNVPPTSDSFTFNLHIQWLDSAGNGIRSDVFQTLTGTTAGWQQVAKTLSAPAGTAQARLVLSAGNLNASIYVDDFSFSPAP
jgi:hypothetical protein